MPAGRARIEREGSRVGQVWSYRKTIIYFAYILSVILALWALEKNLSLKPPLHPVNALRQDVPLAAGSSYHLQQTLPDAVGSCVHFHPELELVYVVAGTGTRFVGPSAEPYGSGDLVLLGSNLPHLWHPARRPVGQLAADRSIVVHLRPNFLGGTFLDLPELTPMHSMLMRAKQGLCFSRADNGHTRQAVEKLLALPTLDGLEAITQLFGILTQLADAPARQLVTVEGSHVIPLSQGRLDRVMAYLARNFQEPLSLADIAQVAAMTPNAFCRYFRSATGRNIFGMLSELRVNYASRRLVETDAKIATIALDSGFESLSSFNRQFLKFKCLQPLAFRKRFRKVRLPMGLLSA